MIAWYASSEIEWPSPAFGIMMSLIHVGDLPVVLNTHWVMMRHSSGVEAQCRAMWETSADVLPHLQRIGLPLMNEQFLLAQNAGVEIHPVRILASTRST